MLDAARNPLALARYELKRFRGPLPRIALVFIMLVPLLYSGVFLAANWDPYGRLDQVPVAVVNHDVPTTVNGSRVAAGDDFVASLYRAGTFHFVETDAADAADGLERGTYYLVITVPATFSTDLVSGQGSDPRRAQIMLQRNDANGFVIGTITNSAQNSIARAIDETAVQSYFEAVFANLATIREGMQQAADGADQLDAGLGRAHEGSAALTSGLAEARQGADAASSGASELAKGASAAATGAGQLASGLGTLEAGAGRLASGSAQVAAGTQQAADALDPVLTLAADKLPAVQRQVTTAADAAAQLTRAVASDTDGLATTADAAGRDLTALVAAHPELADDPTVVRLQGRLGAMSERTATVAQHAATVASEVDQANAAIRSAGDLSSRARDAQQKVDALNDGAHQVAAGAAELSAGMKKAAESSRTLASGVSALSQGASELAQGNARLASGLRQLSDGATQLEQGVGQASEGAHELATGLADGVQRLPVLTEDQQQDAAQVLAAPVDVTMEVDNPAHVYGRGLAPLFFSIALWVLGITAFFIVRPMTGRVIAGRAGDLRIAVTAWLPLGAITVVAGWIMLAVAWVGLGLDPVHPGLTILFVTVVALAFSAVAHLLRSSLGMVASAAMLILVILQLASSGGTYPPELLPPFFAAMGHVMPMTYTIEGFRVVISGGLMERFLLDLAAMIALFVTCMGLLVLVVRRKRRFGVKDLSPALG